MRATVATGRTAALASVLLWATLVPVEQTEPLRKSDLVRLLAGAAVSRGEIAELVRRRCLSFTPTARDRADLISLGADGAIMARVDECTRRAGAPAPRRVPPPPSAPRPPGRSSVTPAPSLPVPPRPIPRPVMSPQRTAFVSGGGQRGRVGTELPLPLVFEVRDTTNAPVTGYEVAFTGTNARVRPERTVTDSFGQARVSVVLGPRAQPATVRARAGAIERQVSLLALAGPPARVVLRCGVESLSAQVVLRSGGAARLEVELRDALGNPVPVSALRAVVGDEGLVRVAEASADGGRGVLSLQARRTGSTNLSVLAAGLRENLTAVVSPSGPVGCRPRL
ncbi:MAG TPA: Ig-like domain-containing protein [Gemmatimonadales bacterium]